MAPHRRDIRGTEVADDGHLLGLLLFRCWCQAMLAIAGTTPTRPGPPDPRDPGAVGQEPGSAVPARSGSGPSG